MIKKNLICLFFLVLIITGCSLNNIQNIDVNTIKYNLDISKTFNEEIIFSFDDNNIIKDNEDVGGEYRSLKEEVINDKIYSLYYDVNKYYNKEISKGKSTTNVKLKYKYIEDEFIYPNLIMSCFENYEINSKDDYFEINLMGKFGCLDNMNKVDINITSDYDVIDSNGELVDNKYHWVIDKNNEDFTFISFKIARDYDKMSKEVVNNKSNGIFVGIIKIIGLVVVIFILYKLYLKLKLKMDF